MDEAQCACMQSLTRAYLEAVLYESLVCRRAFAAQYLHASISFVAEKRMSYMLHVGTYLMGTARLQSAFYERYIAEVLYHAPMSHRFLADTRLWRHHSHAQSVFRVACDVALNASFVLGEVAPHHSVVRAMRCLVEEL